MTECGTTPLEIQTGAVAALNNTIFKPAGITGCFKKIYPIPGGITPIPTELDAVCFRAYSGYHTEYIEIKIAVEEKICARLNYE